MNVRKKAPEETPFHLSGGIQFQDTSIAGKKLGETMEKVLSIIIPAYNSEKYLDCVLKSLLCTSVSRNLDIIVVNDGSTDGTATVCQKYCDQWPNIVRLISQPNKGHGGALNTGIAAAAGKYLKVIDSDDWIESSNLPAFIGALSKCNCDAVLTHFSTYNIGDHTTIQWKSYPKESNKIYTLTEIIEDWGAFNQVTAFHGITYRTDFYRNTQVQLTEHVSYEDLEYCTIPFSHAKTIMPLDLLIYHYRIGDPGQSVSPENLRKNIKNFDTVLNNLISEYTKLPENCGDAGRQYYCRMVKTMLSNYLMIVMLSSEEQKQGRKQGAAIMKDFQSRMPEVYRREFPVYCTLRVLNYLHISKQTCDRVLCSDWYTRLRYSKSLSIIQRDTTDDM